MDGWRAQRVRLIGRAMEDLDVWLIRCLEGLWNGRGGLLIGRIYSRINFSSQPILDDLFLWKCKTALWLCLVSCLCCTTKKLHHITKCSVELQPFFFFMWLQTWGVVSPEVLRSAFSLTLPVLKKIKVSPPDGCIFFPHKTGRLNARLSQDG